MIEITERDAAIRIVLALVIGGVIGLEREWKSKSAGLRTYALVCEGAALFMIGSLMLFNEVRAAGGTTADPSRIASNVVQGIGFLAGGVIFTGKGHVKGLTTAAGIWVTSALGVLVGMGYFVVAATGAVATLVVLSLFNYLEQWLPVPDDSEGHSNVPDEAHEER
jgi:putative Mg2+ transporter-C (MgtC) family protein